MKYMISGIPVNMSKTFWGIIGATNNLFDWKDGTSAEHFIAFHIMQKKYIWFGAFGGDSKNP